MEASVIRRLSRRSVTVSHVGGHEFDVEAAPGPNAGPPRLFATRWKNNRLPLDANRVRRTALVVAEVQFREHGIM